MCNHYRTDRSNWQVVSRNNPCPICGKPDNCKISDDRLACYCWRAGGVHLSDGLSWQPRESYTPKRNGRSQPTPRLTVVRPPKEYNTSTAKVHYSIASEDLADWPEHLGIRDIGLRRMQVRNAGKCLIYPESWRFDPAEADLTEAGYNRRFRDGSKFQFRNNPRGCTAWGDGDTVHVVEGMTDAATLASLGLTVISRPGTMDVSAEICVLTDGQEVVIWGDRDGGQDKARPFAQAIADATGKDVLLVFAPDGIRDVRRWWQTWCTEHDVSPHLASDADANLFRQMVNVHVQESAECVTRDDRITLARLNKIEESRTERIIDLRQQYRGKCGLAWIAHGDEDNNGKVRPFIPNLPCKKNSCGNCKKCRNEQIARDFSILAQYRWETECSSREEFDEITEQIHSIPVGDEEECVSRFETFAATSTKDNKFIIRSKMKINDRSTPCKLSAVYVAECSDFTFPAMKKSIERSGGNYKAFRVSEFGIVVVTDVAIEAAKKLATIDAIAEIHELAKRSVAIGVSSRRVTSSRLWLVRFKPSKVKVIASCRDLDRVKEIASKRYAVACDYELLENENIPQHLVGLPRKMTIEELTYFANEVSGGGAKFAGDLMPALDALVYAWSVRRSSPMRETQPKTLIRQLRQPTQLQLAMDEGSPPDPLPQAG